MCENHQYFSQSYYHNNNWEIINTWTEPNVLRFDCKICDQTILKVSSEMISPKDMQRHINLNNCDEVTQIKQGHFLSNVTFTKFNVQFDNNRCLGIKSQQFCDFCVNQKIYDKPENRQCIFRTFK